MATLFGFVYSSPSKVTYLSSTFPSERHVTINVEVLYDFMMMYNREFNDVENHSGITD